MAYVLRGEGDYGTGASVIPTDSAHHSVLVPDAELLLTGEFRRAGPDLILTGHDGRHHLIPGYFSSEQPPPLVAPNGAHLSGSVATMLAGSPTPGEYAQAGNTLPPDAIGHVEKVVGDVTVVRNGVVVALNVGDAVYKSDVVQTGANSSAGIAFPDGTALDLVANTRMALNEYSYDQSGAGNGALFTLVDGTFAFVAGKVAHTGNMKIDTPVATMGIRGTTGMVEKVADIATITANFATGTYAFLVTRDFGSGVTGAFDVYATDGHGNILRDANGDPILLATISQNGLMTFIQPQGVNELPHVTTELLSQAQITFEQQVLEQLFLTLNPINLQNPNNGSSTPPPIEIPNIIPQLLENSGTPVNINNPGNGGNGGNTNGGTVTITAPPHPSGPTTTVTWISDTGGSWESGGNWSDDIAPTSFSLVEILFPVIVTIGGNESANGLELVSGATLEIESGASLTVLDSIQGAGTVELNSTTSDPTLWIDGTVTLTGGGTIEMSGAAGDNSILGVPVADSISGDPAYLLNVDDTIKGAGAIGNGDGNLVLDNFGTVVATGCLTIDTGNEVYNEDTGVMLAVHHGNLVIDDDLDNSGLVLAAHHGTIDFNCVTVINEAGATIEAKDYGIIRFDHSDVVNDGLIQTDCGGEIIFDHSHIDNYGNFNTGGVVLFEYCSGTNYFSDSDNGDNGGNGSAGGTITFEHSDLDNQGKIGGGSTVFNFDHGHLDNQYEIDAEGCGTFTFCDSYIDNAGTIAVTCGGTVYVNDSTINNCGGTIAVNGADSTLDLSGSTIVGGMIDLAGVETAQSITEISVPDYNSVAPSISGDGQLIAFATSNEVPNLNGSVELYDTDGGTLTNISALVPSGDLHPGEIFTDIPEISANGEYVVFKGDYQVTSDDQTYTQSEVYLYNVQNQQVTDLGQGGAPAISGNGSTIVMEDTPAIEVKNDAGTTLTTITGDPNYTQPENTSPPFGNAGSVYDPAVSGNGQYISFWTTAYEVVINGTTYLTGNTTASAGVAGVPEVYVYDTETGTLQMVSVNNQGQPGNSGSGATTLASDQDDNPSTLSANGTYVVFQSSATNLVAGAGSGAETNGVTSLIASGSSNVYLYDTQTHTITLVSGGLNGTAANGASYFPTISADGNYVIFESTATNLVAGDTTGEAQTYIYNVLTGVITLASAAVDGTPGDGESDLASSISADGSIVSFGSFADNLVASTTNSGDANIYLVSESTGPSGTVDVSGDVTIKNGAVIEGGTVNLASDSTLILTNATVNGSTLTANASNAAVALTGGVTLNYATLGSGNGGFIGNSSGINTLFNVAILAGTLLQTSDGSTLNLTGTTTLDDGTVTFNGGGLFELTGTGAQIVAATSDPATLDNQGTIAGAGTIGNDGLTIDNQYNEASETGGTINANVNGATLTLDTGCNTIINCSTLEASCGGTLLIASKLDNSGQVGASDGGHVQIDANVFNETNGEIAALAGSTLSITGSCITNNGNIGVAFGGGCIVIDCSHIDNSGLIGTNSTGSVTIDHSHIDNASGISGDGGNLEGIGADGGGSILIKYSFVDNSQESSLISAQDDSSITLSHDHIVNDGTLVDDSDSDGILAYDGGVITIDCSTVCNSGQIGAFTGGGEEPSAGALYIENSTITNTTGGTIDASGCGDVVQFSDATIVGGMLQSGDGGKIEVAAAGDSDTSTLEGGSVAGNSTISVPAYAPSTEWNATGIEVTAGELITISAAGTISIGHDIMVGGQNVSLETPGGDPNITTSDEGGGFLAPGLVPWSLVGQIDGGPAFEVGSSDTFVAAATGELYLSVNDNYFPDNSGDWTASVTLTSTPLVNDAFVQVDAGANLDLTGAIDNEATINVAAATSDTPANLVINGTVALLGSGDVVLNGAYDSITGTGDGILYNVGNEISGAGTIGNGNTVVSVDGTNTVDSFADLPTKTDSLTLTLVNDTDGVINADVSGQMLTINTGCIPVINDGTLQATNGGILDVASAVCGTGAVTIGHDSTVDFQSSVPEGQTITYADGTGTLALADPGDFSATIANLMVGDVIDLTNIAPADIVSTNIVAGQLVVDETGGGSLTFNIAGDLTGNAFIAGSDSDGGTDLTLESTGWSGDTLQETYFYPTLANTYYTSSTFVVPASHVEANPDDNGNAAFLSVATNSITANFGFNSSWNSAAFNGFIISDLSGNPDISGVTVDASTNMSGFNSSDISFSSNAIWVNWEGLSFNPSTILKLDVTFGSDPVIASGESFTVNGASNETVTFDGSTGTLVLDKPMDFTGQIADFTGTSPDAAHSDQVELAGTWTTNSTLTGTDGNLQVALHDGDQSATLTFDDFSGTLDISDVGGNTFISDPPASSISHGMNFASDQIKLASGNSTGSSDHGPSSVATTGDDNFVFHGGFSGASGLQTQLQHVDFNHSNVAPNQPPPNAAETHIALAYDPAHTDSIVNHAMDQFHQIVASVGHH